MGLRFRRSVKICKGVRVNFSKSGISYSFGGRGASITVGKHGTRATLGIPGTGLSYSEYVGNNRKKNNTSSSYYTKPQKTIVRAQVKIYMDENGKMTYRFADGRAITDPSLIRKIKSTPEFKTEYARMESERQRGLAKTIEDNHKSEEEFLNLHWLAPRVSTQQDYVSFVNSLSPNKYVPRQYPYPKPTSEQVKNELFIEAKTTVKTKIFWKKNSLYKNYVDAHFAEKLADCQKKWENNRSEFEANESILEKQRNKTFLEEYEARRQNILLRINGEENTINEVIERWINECTLPVEINIDYDYSQSDHTLLIDLDLPEIEDIPNIELVQLASGNLKEKKKTQQKLRRDYATLVFGISIFVTANLMNLTPAIHKVILSGYTQRRDSSGNLNDDYILSIKFTRNTFEQTSFRKIDPMEFCMQFENRCNTTSTMLFKKIEPYSN